MSKIIGTTVSTTTPRPNYNQTDPSKADYIINRPFYDNEDGTVAKRLDNKYLSILEKTYPGEDGYKIKPEYLPYAGGASITVTDDDNGNVIITSQMLTVTDDNNGNVILS